MGVEFFSESPSERAATNRMEEQPASDTQRIPDTISAASPPASVYAGEAIHINTSESDNPAAMDPMDLVPPERIPYREADGRAQAATDILGLTSRYEGMGDEEDEAAPETLPSSDLLSRGIGSGINPVSEQALPTSDLPSREVEVRTRGEVEEIVGHGSIKTTADTAPNTPSSIEDEEFGAERAA